MSRDNDENQAVQCMYLFIKLAIIILNLQSATGSIICWDRMGDSAHLVRNEAPVQNKVTRGEAAVSGNNQYCPYLTLLGDGDSCRVVSDGQI